MQLVLTWLQAVANGRNPALDMDEVLLGQTTNPSCRSAWIFSIKAHTTSYYAFRSVVFHLGLSFFLSWYPPLFGGFKGTPPRKTVFFGVGTPVLVVSMGNQQGHLNLPGSVFF